RIEEGRAYFLQLVNEAVLSFLKPIRVLPSVTDVPYADMAASQQAHGGSSARVPFSIGKLRLRMHEVVRCDIAKGRKPHVVQRRAGTHAHRARLAGVLVDPRQAEPLRR